MLKSVQNAGSMLSSGLKAKQQQEKFEKLLEGIVVTGTSKNGKVSVTMNGKQKILEILIDPAIIKFVYENFLTSYDPNNAGSVEMASRGQKFMSSPIMEAIEDAISKVQQETIKKIQESGSMGDLMDMFKTATGGM